MQRVRKCADCGKPLGGTLGKCYECGGEKSEPTREERLQDAFYWKVVGLGIKPSVVEEAHEQE